jgi:hypothetical protein
MNTQFTLARAAACLLLTMAGAHAHAQQAAQAAAADPQAAVLATRYQAALPARPAPAADGTPDHNWVASNQKAAATNSMALTMKPMAGMAMEKPAESPAMCTPAGGDGPGKQCKMPCCASCACMNQTRDAAKDAPAADPHARHHQETQ